MAKGKKPGFFHNEVWCSRQMLSLDNNIVVVGDAGGILRMYQELKEFIQTSLSWEKDAEENDFNDEIELKWGRIVIPRFSNIKFLTLGMSFFFAKWPTTALL